MYGGAIPFPVELEGIGQGAEGETLEAVAEDYAERSEGGTGGVGGNDGSGTGEEAIEGGIALEVEGGVEVVVCQ